MPSLISTFNMAFFLLIVVFTILVFRDSTLKVKHNKQIENISMLTKLPGISLSTSFLEHRIPFYEDYSNEFYLNMDVHRFTDFMYVK